MEKVMRAGTSTESSRRSEKILLVESDAGIQSLVTNLLSHLGYAVDTVSSTEHALNALKAGSWDLILLDVQLPGMSAVQAIPSVKRIAPETVIMLMTLQGVDEGHGSVAEDDPSHHLLEPLRLEELGNTIKHALQKGRVLNDVVSRRIVGESRHIIQLKSLIRRIAPLDSTVLITGESGTGKELVADMIHHESNRASHPFVKINCAAIPEGLLEGEIFGYEKGAFTGAVTQRPGKFELSHKGTMLLDEIGDMPLSTQAKLLRVVEQKQVERLGGRRPISVDTRIIAATNQGLPDLIRQKKFRDDLYYRLNVAAIHIPPLRERMEDMPLLVEHFLGRTNFKLGTCFSAITKESMELLFSYHWPGNIRELANVIERAVIFGDGEEITASDLAAAMPDAVGAAPARTETTELPDPLGTGWSLNKTLSEVEKRLIMGALARSGGVQSEAARILHVSPKNLWKKIQKYSIDTRSCAHARVEASTFDPLVEIPGNLQMQLDDDVIIFPRLKFMRPS
jgi:two-component system response regulator AtoC